MENIVVWLNENWEVVLAVFGVIAVLVAKAKIPWVNDLFEAVKLFLQTLKESKKKPL